MLVQAAIKAAVSSFRPMRKKQCPFNLRLFITHFKRKTLCNRGLQKKAAEGIRTLDIHVGNVTLYH